jgi:hypothetical protein
MSKATKPKKAEEVIEIPQNVVESTRSVEEVQAVEPSQFEVIKAETKPVTLAGKTVPISASGKARLINTRTNRIITGFVDYKIALEQTKLFPHIKIVNENEQKG